MAIQLTTPLAQAAITGVVVVDLRFHFSPPSGATTATLAYVACDPLGNILPGAVTQFVQLAAAPGCLPSPRFRRRI